METPLDAEEVFKKLRSCVEFHSARAHTEGLWRNQFSDYVSAAHEAICRALLRYDPSKAKGGVEYIRRRISGAVSDVNRRPLFGGRYHWKQLGLVYIFRLSMWETIGGSYDPMEQVELRLDMKRAIDAVKNEGDRRVIFLLMTGLDQRDVARKMGCHETRISQRLQRIRATMGEQLADYLQA